MSANLENSAVATGLKKVGFHSNFKKRLKDLVNHNDVATHLQPDILECEVKWALRSITTKLVEVMEFQLSYLKS